MREILKSKIMILFIALVLGITYFDSLATEKLEDENLESYRDAIAMNVR